MLANEDRTKWDFFLEMQLTEFLNTIAFVKDRNKKNNEAEKDLNRTH